MSVWEPLFAKLTLILITTELLFCVLVVESCAETFIEYVDQICCLKRQTVCVPAGFCPIGFLERPLERLRRIHCS